MYEPFEADKTCSHGTALDVHCCACRRSGFFPPDDCDCYREPTIRALGDGRAPPGADRPMTICTGLAGKGKVYEGRKCGALAEPGHEYCTIHLQAAGFKRCVCGHWTRNWSTCPGCGAGLDADAQRQARELLEQATARNREA